MTLFQRKVYDFVRKIPKGSVATYSQVARAIGSPKAWRAVGNVLAKNEDIKDIPCHRVIKDNMEVGKYRYGKNKKISLLKSEGIIIKNGKVVL